jgi:hypothetical protein
LGEKLGAWPGRESVGLGAAGEVREKKRREYALGDQHGAIAAAPALCCRERCREVDNAIASYLLLFAIHNCQCMIATSRHRVIRN